MKKELRDRLITSFLLIIITFSIILINEIFFLFFIFLLLFYSSIEWGRLNFNYFKRKKIKYKLIVLLGSLYAIFVFISVINLRGKGLDDGIYFIYLLSICAGSDIGGYLFGKTFGGKKLIKKISPNKTISGSFGSFVFSILPLIVLNFQSYVFFNLNLTFKNFIFCLLVSFFCQTGDLIISYFKRLNKVKDTGTILPGHGGILDRIDGIIFALPIIYIFEIINIF